MPDMDLPILLDRQTGGISNATAVERLGLKAMALAHVCLRPLGGLGFSIVARAIAGVFRSNRQVCALFGDDCRFSFPYGDAYWSILTDRSHTYEPGVERVLRRFKDVRYAFVDCGANYGYWSCQVTSKSFGSKEAVAIELDPATFGQLVHNAAENKSRFEVANRAVSDTDDEWRPIYGTKHEARTLVQGGLGGVSQASTVTIRLDTLVGSRANLADMPLIIKLDVEGVEIEAMDGAGSLLDGELLFIYEDHGSDPTHSVTRHVMDTLGMRVFGHSVQTGLFELRSLDELSRIKTNRRWGYDFFATRDSTWLERLTSLFAAQDRRQDDLAAVA
ncbi:FkbM family methyltransferase [Roseibium aquae]|uniref:FkbM family methyltransferase n=1 Tax=Roseibium aquae TaxID=1323746 RepID=A0A916TMW1_9HYPH|nr:FkbM family methyltransferase [Roseibium aquae]GGB60594.1 FkbM family methyltransferase [Roseibium aquae]